MDSPEYEMAREKMNTAHQGGKMNRKYWHWQPSHLKLVRPGDNTWSLYSPWSTNASNDEPLLSGSGKCTDLDREKAMNILEMQDRIRFSREAK